MLRSDYVGENCSIARALELVGERWTLLIVRELLKGPQRFGRLNSSLGIAKNVLAARLAKLLDAGVAEKVPADGPRTDRNVYRLTEKGLDLFYVIDALMAWGDKYAAPDGPPAVFHHSCGQPAGHRVVCVACGEDVTPQDIRGVPGPGLRRPAAAG